MIRKIIHIDEEKCNGCGICADACHEGAIDIVDGKAKLVREISVMALEIVFPDVRREPLHLKNGKLPHTTKKRYGRRRRIKK